MDERTYTLPEAKLVQLLYNAMAEGYVYAVIEDMPNPNLDPEEDFDPMDKGEGTERWVRERSKELRKSLRRYRHKASSQRTGES